MSTSKNITRITIIVMALSASSKVLGLIRESILADKFGASYQTDAFKIAYSIPFILLSLVTTSIATTFIPVFTEYIKRKSEEERLYFINNIFNIVIIISLGLTVLGMLFTPVIVRIVAPGFSGDVYRLAIKLTVIMFPTLVFLALANITNGYLQAYNRFVIPAFMWIPYNAAVIVSTGVFYRYGIESVAVGDLLGVICLFLVQIPSVMKTGYRYRPVIDFREKGMRKICSLLAPVLISSAFNQIYVVVDRMLASGLSEGSVSALDYANKVNSIVYNIFILSVVTVIYPKLSVISDDENKFGYVVTKGLKVIMLISLPMMAGMFILREPVINILFERGEFTSKDTYITSEVLGCFALGIVGVGFREILNRAFYALKNTRIPMINGITVIAINIALSLLLVRWGPKGLALATSVSAIASGGMMLVRLRKKPGCINGNDIGSCLVKAAVASLLMGVTVYLSERLLGECFPGGVSFIAKGMKLTATITAGALVYGVLLYVMKVHEMRHMLDILKNRIGLLNIKAAIHRIKRLPGRADLKTKEDGNKEI